MGEIIWRLSAWVYKNFLNSGGQVFQSFVNSAKILVEEKDVLNTGTCCSIIEWLIAIVQVQLTQVWGLNGESFFFKVGEED